MSLGLIVLKLFISLTKKNNKGETLLKIFNAKLYKLISTLALNLVYQHVKFDGSRVNGFQVMLRTTFRIKITKGYNSKNI